MKLSILTAVLVSMFSFTAVAEHDAQAGSLPSIVKEKAEVLAQLPIVVVGKTVKLAGKVLSVGGELVVRLADGTRVLVRNVGRGVIKIVCLGGKALRFTLKIAKRGVLYTVHAAKWVITKVFKGATYIGKAVGKTIKPVLRIVVKGGKLIVRKAVKFPAMVLRSLGEIVGGIFEAIFG